MNPYASQSHAPVVLAVFAHPDDVEFTCAGTLALLRDAGCETHYLNLANGCCGSMDRSRGETAALRWQETRNAAETLGAVPHPPLFNDLEICYTPENLERVAAVFRDIRPDIVLTHALEDYMEDHMQTARLAVSALFVAGMPNYQTRPERPPFSGERALYHTLPHGFRRPADGTRVYPALYVGIDAVMSRKRQALACHRSQKEWLDQTQGMDAYLDTQAELTRTLGSESGAGMHAEGFTQHLSLGFAAESHRPLQTLLADSVRLNSRYPLQP
ncbi:MAG: PIG-L deacetylase family protein [Kiritimatiellia bacterium]